MMNYDVACGELARHFLGVDASKDSIDALATHIQEAVEGWLFEEEKRREPPDPIYYTDG